MDFVKAFVCGGLICVLTQILMEKTKLMPGRIMVILVQTGVVLGAEGIYETLEYMSLLLNLQEREQQFRLQDLAMSYGRA